MSDPETLLAKAHEAERMSEIVSYGNDRVRLARQAEAWRDEAARLQASGNTASAGDAGPPPSGLHRLAQALLHPRRLRGG